MLFSKVDRVIKIVVTVSMLLALAQPLVALAGWARYRSYQGSSPQADFTGDPLSGEPFR